ncbi:MarR family winged helix-turn-helix transcriptional regulator [Priestia endophytica]|jgi:MarR family 2-MHQ and catechol resistance regulon transcriptional repressor|uniref:MarR family transcriptional regulator n=2 Tax=Priestia endophytica TaxID=135735 RepID=A0AAX1Q647_9BACI|nr:MarR family transcriptional regulator [Priestia endophytica]KAB2496261.1 MarR family transcriptional regulator [Priestia endophytica]KYG31361.1 transcriptional regulator [Priestia endophytica]MBG9811769.1 transcriptional regulator [Priestia endophytica]MCM3536790.1 MarR family transcriptional regulator [Priestia endophytica]RAS72183.1 MarR family transcriptional regulator [Priestia endophytica]
MGNELTNKELDQSLKLFIVLSRASRSVNDQVQHIIQGYGMNPTEFAVLELLYHKGGQPLQQIGGKILLASGSITYVVDKLEKKGFLKRVACPTDRRVTYAEITDEGKKIIEDIFKPHAERIHELFNPLSQDEKETAIELLKKVGLHASSFHK